MAAAWCLRWTLRRAGAWLLPPPVRCPRRALHKQADGTEFQSIYSLDKLYPESRGSDTAWRVPVRGEGSDGRGVSRSLLGDVGKPGRHWAGRSKLKPRAELGGGRGRELVAGASGDGAEELAWPPGRPGGVGASREHAVSYRTTSFSAFVPRPPGPHVGISPQNGQ